MDDKIIGEDFDQSETPVKRPSQGEVEGLIRRAITSGRIRILGYYDLLAEMVKPTRDHDYK